MKVMNVLVCGALAMILGMAPAARADSLSCDMGQYAAADGLKAGVEANVLVVTWKGQGPSSELRARFVIDGGQPVVRDLAFRKTGGWTLIGENLIPEYRVTSGIRRMSEQQAGPLRAAGIELTQEVIDKNRWYAFWDAPLVVPDGKEKKDAPPRYLGATRSPSDIRRATASFKTSSCSVKTDGASLSVTFPGLSMGIFAGDLRFTVYRGTNLIRMDAVAKTDEWWVAYKYEAGLRGF